jgi:hypothetical protein
MDLPIRFPSDADVIAEEAARFRALPPEKQVRVLGESFREYLFLAAAGGRRDIDRYAREEERLGQAAIEEFIARHG